MVAKRDPTASRRPTSRCRATRRNIADLSLLSALFRLFLGFHRLLLFRRKRSCFKDLPMLVENTKIQNPLESLFNLRENSSGGVSLHIRSGLGAERGEAALRVHRRRRRCRRLGQAEVE